MKSNGKDYNMKLGEFIKKNRLSDAMHYDLCFSCDDEQFLLDLVNEYKAQNSNNEKFIKTLPESLSKSLEKAVTDSAVPYLENILYSLNKLNDLIGRNGNGDIIDRLF